MAKLPKAKFNLRLPSAKSETLISLVFRYNGRRLVYSTGYSIHPRDWDSKLQRPIQQERRPGLFLIQRGLDDLSTHCINIFIDSDYGNIKVKDFKQRLDVLTGKFGEKEDSAQNGKKDRPTFLEYVSMELQEMKRQGMRKSSWKGFN